MKSPEFKIPDYFSKSNEVLRRIQENMRPFIERMNEITRQVAENMRPFIERMNEITRQVAKTVSKAFAELPEKQRKVMYHCIRTGWYFSYLDASVTGVFALADRIDNKQFEQVEMEIQDFAKTQIDKTLNQVKSNWPHRFNIINDAFKAHKQGQYTLSIPVLLAQADGISQDILGEQLFKKKSGKPETKKALEQYLVQYEVFVSTIYNALLDPLREVTSLVANTNDRDEKRKEDPLYGPLNRHGVLHGIDVDYATEANSLRAIMLINYLADVKHILDTKDENDNDYKQT